MTIADNRPLQLVARCPLHMYPLLRSAFGLEFRPFRLQQRSLQDKLETPGYTPITAPP